MPATKERAGEKTPLFDRTRCKRCGICAHFCPFGAIALREDGTPYLAKPEACTSCRLCQDMCPDWAIRLAANAPEDEADASVSGEAAAGEEAPGAEAPGGAPSGVAGEGGPEAGADDDGASERRTTIRPNRSKRSHG